MKKNTSFLFFVFLKAIMLLILVGCKKEDVGNNRQFTDARDGTTYKTIQIGNQTWMAENLNFAVAGSWMFENGPANAAIYGRLYDWKTACKVCPDGWRLPSKEDWDQLINHLGGDLSNKESFVGGYLKEAGTAHWERPNIRATNSSGFTALPGGQYESGIFISKGTIGSFWTASEYVSASMIEFNLTSWLTFSANLFYNDAMIDIFPTGREGGKSVRCIKK